MTTLIFEGKDLKAIAKDTLNADEDIKPIGSVKTRDDEI